MGHCPGCTFGPMNAPHNGLGVYCGRPKHAHESNSLFSRVLRYISGK